MDVSIIIVNYNTLDILKNCLNSIFEQTVEVKYEIIVVDNASTDGSQQMIKENFPQITLIENKLNLGFGSANNLGAKIAKGKYLLLLNSDCLLIENTIKVFYDFMEMNNIDGSIGVIGAMLYDKMMKPNNSYHKFPIIGTSLKVIIISFYNKLFLQSIALPKTSNYNQSKYSNEVDFISGADLFISKKIFDELNGFDEQFFLFFEETDLQKRMAKKGLKRIILRNQKIIHLEGHSSKTSTPSVKLFLIYRDSMYKYFRKNASFISYNFFYYLTIPLVIVPLLSKKYSGKEKKRYLKKLLRIPINEPWL